MFIRVDGATQLGFVMGDEVYATDELCGAVSTGKSVATRVSEMLLMSVRVSCRMSGDLHLRRCSRSRNFRCSQGNEFENRYRKSSVVD